MLFTNKPDKLSAARMYKALLKSMSYRYLYLPGVYIKPHSRSFPSFIWFVVVVIVIILMKASALYEALRSWVDVECSGLGGHFGLLEGTVVSVGLQQNSTPFYS
jgi:hypothetical protein